MEKELISNVVRDFVNIVIGEVNERKEYSDEVDGDKVRNEPITEDEFDTDFTEVGVDSLGYIRLIILLEGYYNIEFEDEDILSHKMKSVNGLCSMVYDKLSTN